MFNPNENQSLMNLIISNSALYSLMFSVPTFIGASIYFGTPIGASMIVAALTAALITAFLILIGLINDDLLFHKNLVFAMIPVGYLAIAAAALMMSQPIAAFVLGSMFLYIDLSIVSLFALTIHELFNFSQKSTEYNSQSKLAV